MDKERAIEILDPVHRERYGSIEPVNEACRMGRAERVPMCAGCTGARILPVFHAGRPAEKLEDHQQRKSARR